MRFRNIFFVACTIASSAALAYTVEGSMTKEAIRERLAPVGEATVVGGGPVEAAAPVVKAKGQNTYESYCIACHGQGIAGAPKYGDKAAWNARLKQGHGTLVARAMSGFNAMPPKGTCVTCTEADITDAIDFMLAKIK